MEMIRQYHGGNDFERAPRFYITECGTQLFDSVIVGKLRLPPMSHDGKKVGPAGKIKPPVIAHGSDDVTSQFAGNADALRLCSGQAYPGLQSAVGCRPE
jgi:hypothetical protein